MPNIKSLNKSYGINRHRFFELYYMCLQYNGWKAHNTNPEKIRIIEETAKAADEELSEYILYAVTHERTTYDSMRTSLNMPACRNRYYESRRRFYWLLDKKIK